MTIGVEIASELLSHWAATQDLFVRDRPHLVRGDDKRDYYLWTLDNATEGPVHVTISEQEIDQNMKRRDQMISLVAHRFNIGLVTARNRK